MQKLSPQRRRVLIASIAVLTALALIAGTWLVATRFQSSAQRQAAAEPPPAQPILVDVVRTDLVERTSMKVTAERSNEREYILPRPAATSVVTREGMRAGQDLASGQVLTWINDRPLFALRGPFPLYRDIGQGDTGEDVRMIQQALADLGYEIAPDGVFGAWTAQKIRELFEENGADVATREAKEQPASSTQNQADQNQSAQTHAPTSPTRTKVQTEVVLRASEVIILPELPAHIGSVPTVGTTLGDEDGKFTLTGSEVKLLGEVPGPIAVRMAAGRKGTATLEDTTIDVQIASIEEKKNENIPGSAPHPDTDQGGAAVSVIQFTPTSGSIPTEWAGRNDILITLDLSDPLIDVLTVPQRAIAVDASGAAHVLVEEGTTFTQVPIKQLSCITGMCAIEPATPGGMPKEGQRVRVDR